MSTLRSDGLCFVCGPRNERGLNIRVEGHDGRCSFRWTPETTLQGWEGILHGGIVTAILDEAMAYAAMSIAGHSATTEITVSFRRPVMTGREVEVRAEVESNRGRLTLTRGEVLQDGHVMATGKARFIAVRDSKAGVADCQGN
jgi:uncharacterized protein (TIGR00369 family)